MQDICVHYSQGSHTILSTRGGSRGKYLGEQCPPPPKKIEKPKALSGKRQTRENRRAKSAEMGRWYPPLYPIRVLGSVVSSLSGARGRAPAEKKTHLGKAGFTLSRALFRKKCGAPFNWDGRPYFPGEKTGNLFCSSLSFHRFTRGSPIFPTCKNLPLLS